MATASKIVRNFYRDSVSLMQLSSRLAKLPGIVQASAVMASEANLALLREAKLLDEPPTIFSLLCKERAKRRSPAL